MEARQAEALRALAPGSTVLEIGCGGGQNRKFIQGLGHQYIGTDVSKTRVFDWLQAFGGPDFLCDAHFLPFEEQTFDAVYCTAVFEHLASPPIAALEVHRVLKPGGVFLGNVSFLEPWHDNSYTHMSPLGVLRLLDGAGFEIQAIWPEEGSSGFHAMPRSSRGLKLMKPLGAVMHGVYMLEAELKRLLRRTNPTEAEVLARQAVITCAVFWQARRPT
jgi:SAM-dependent methyltransferase